MINKIIKSVIDSNSKRAEMLRFVIVGVLATGIQYGAYLLCLSTEVIVAQLATAISYCISLVVNFILSNIFTFQTKASTKKAAGFFVSHMINMGLQITLVSLFSLIIQESLALFPAMIICVPVNFLLVRFALKGKAKCVELESQSI